MAVNVSPLEARHIHRNSKGNSRQNRVVFTCMPYPARRVHPHGFCYGHAPRLAAASKPFRRVVTIARTIARFVRRTVGVIRMVGSSTAMQPQGSDPLSRSFKSNVDGSIAGSRCVSVCVVGHPREIQDVALLLGWQGVDNVRDFGLIVATITVRVRRISPRCGMTAKRTTMYPFLSPAA